MRPPILVTISKEDVEKLNAWLKQDDEGIMKLSKLLRPLLHKNMETIRSMLNKWFSSKKVNPVELVKIEKALERPLPEFADATLNKRLQEARSNPAPEKPARRAKNVIEGTWYLYTYRLLTEQQAQKSPGIETHVLEVNEQGSSLTWEFKKMTKHFSGQQWRKAHDCYMFSLDNKADRMIYIITGAERDNGGWVTGELMSVSGNGLLRTRYFVGSRKKLKPKQAQSVLQAAGRIFKYEKKVGTLYPIRNQLVNMKSIFDDAKNASRNSGRADNGRE